MKLSAILFVASASAQYESYDNNYANTDNNYAPAQEYDPYGGEYQQYDNTVPADEERRGAQQEPSAPRPGQKNYGAGTGAGYDAGTDTGATSGGSTYGTGDTGAVDNGPSGLTCWHCDAMSFEECEANGEERTCHVSYIIYE